MRDKGQLSGRGINEMCRERGRRDEEGEAMFYKIKMNAKAVSLAMSCGVVVCKVCCKSSNLHAKQETHSGP